MGGGIPCRRCWRWRRQRCEPERAASTPLRNGVEAATSRGPSSDGVPGARHARSNDAPRRLQAAGHDGRRGGPTGMGGRGMRGRRPAGGTGWQGATRDPRRRGARSALGGGRRAHGRPGAGASGGAGPGPRRSRLRRRRHEHRPSRKPNCAWRRAWCGRCRRCCADGWSAGMRSPGGCALLCQKALGRQITQAGGSSLFAVKANQPELLGDVPLLIDQPPPHERLATASSVDKHGGRLGTIEIAWHPRDDTRVDHLHREPQSGGAAVG